MYAFAIYCREDGGGPGIGGRVESGYPDSFRASDGGRGHTASLCRYGAVAGLQHTAGIGRKERLCRTDILIIGGGAIDAGLEAEIRQLPVKVYSTYGMTETLSHIALRQLNGPDASMLYRPFPSVRLSLSSEHTLVIDAPLVCDTTLVTNDVAEIYSDGSFSILGRKDNTINTGGIKVQAEQIEEILRPWMRVPFAITSVPDARLGEAVVLLVEKGQMQSYRKQR